MIFPHLSAAITMLLVALVLMIAKVDAATLTQVIGDNYINVDYEGLTREDYINGFNYFKLQ